MKQSILITGCSSGIGLKVAEDLHNMGYQVFATCRNQPDVDKLKAHGLNSFQLDVTDINSINNTLEKILTITGGKLDVLFNNAGFGIPAAVEDLNTEILTKQFNTNVFGLVDLTNKVLPIMRQQGHGKIIINSSILGFISMRYRGSYISSKFALEGLFRTLRLELKNTPIKVSIIQPGPVTSKFRENAYINFLSHINPETSAHAEQYRIMRKRFVPKGVELPKNIKPEDIKNLDIEHSKTAFELPAASVTKTILKIINSKNPRAYYSITFPTYLFRVLVRILPNFILDKLYFNITKSETE